MEKYLYKELTGKIIDAAPAVHGTLGYGFLEKVYHNALLIELEEQDCKVESQKKMCVNYHKATGLKVGLIINFGPSVQVKRMARSHSV